MKDWQRVEAVLFASGRYLTEDQIIKLSDVPKNKIKKALNELKKFYENSETSLQIFEEQGTWKMNVKEDYSAIVKNIISEAEMPKPVMETLAVIAYKTPVLQAEVIDARGSGAYDHIGLLEEKGFVEKEKYGRTFKLKLGEKFYDYFDIEGPAQIKEVFKGVKMPEKMGDLAVYETDQHGEDFTQTVSERLKKLEITEEETKNNDEFLDKFEEKIASAKNRIDETDKELSEFRKTEAPMQSSQIEPNKTQNPQEDSEKKLTEKKSEDKQEELNSDEEDSEDNEEENNNDENDSEDEDNIDNEESEEDKDYDKEDTVKVLKKVKRDIKKITGEDDD